MLSPSSVITEYVLEKIPAEPVAKRVKLTRALASLSACEEERRSLTAMANELESIETKHQQLVLDFQRRAGR